MVIYILNMLSLLLWGVIYKKILDKRKARIIVCTGIALQFSLIQGLRSFTIGIDTPVYIDKYVSIAESEGLSLWHYLTGNIDIFEPGFKTFIYILGRIGFGPRAYLFITALFINGFLARFIYHESNDIILSFWLFIGMEFFTLSFTTLRQMMAIVLILNSFMFLKENKLFKSFVYLLLAVSFHKTALIFGVIHLAKVLYDLVGKEGKLVKFIIMNRYLLLGLTFPILELLRTFITTFGHKIYDYYNASADLGLLFLIMLGILVFLLFIERYCDDKRTLRYYQLLMYITVCIQYCTTFIALLSRLALFFYVFAIVALPFAMMYVKNERYRRILIFGMMFVFMIQYLFVSMSMYNLVPYSIF